MIKEAYVSFELAKLLEEKGFPISEYSGIYTNKDNLCLTDVGMMSHLSKEDYIHFEDFFIPTITHQMAMAWLREVHNIHISVYVFNRELPITDVPVSYTCDIATKKLSSQQGHLRGIWQSYEQAVEAAIKYCLENLI